MGRRELLAWVERRGGVITRDEALSHFAAHVVDDAIQAKALVRLLPRTYALPHLKNDRPALRRAALAFRPDAALARLDALDEWTLLEDRLATGPIQLVTDERQPRNKVGTIHLSRRIGFRNEPPQVVTRNGRRVTRLEQTIVDSWSQLPPVDRRAPALRAVRERRTTGTRLLGALAANARPPGAAEMRRIFGLVVAGCHSVLELWGHEHVFSVGDLRRAQCQVAVQTRIGRVYLDRYYDEEMLAVEMDGAAYHGSPGQRERDIRRDAAVAALGIQTLRFSHLRLFHNMLEVRIETLQVLAARRRQLRLRPT